MSAENIYSFKKLDQKDKKITDRTVTEIVSQARDSCGKFNITIEKINYEEVALGNENWIEIIFITKPLDKKTFTKINNDLISNLSENEKFLHSDIQYVPIFSEERTICL